MNRVEKSFIKCEFKFFVFLLLGIILLNILGVVLQNIFNTTLLISISISLIALLMYFIYFIYTVIKIVIFKSNYECLNIKQRISSWLSSLI